MNSEENPALRTLTPLWNELSVGKLERNHILRTLRVNCYNLPLYIDGLETLIRIKKEYSMVLNKHRLIYDYLTATTLTETQTPRDILLAIAQFRYYTVLLISLTAEARSVTGLSVTLPSFQICAMDNGNWLTIIRSMHVFTLDRTIHFLSKICAEDPSEPPDQTLTDIRNRVLNWAVDLLDVQNKSVGSVRLRRLMEDICFNSSLMPKMLFDPAISFSGPHLYIDMNIRILLGVPFEGESHPDDIIAKFHKYVHSQVVHNTYYCSIPIKIMSCEEAFNYALGETQRMQIARGMMERLTLHKQAPVLLSIQRDLKRRETYSTSKNRSERFI